MRKPAVQSIALLGILSLVFPIVVFAAPPKGLREITTFEVDSDAVFLMLTLGFEGTGRPSLDAVLFEKDFIQLQIEGCYVDPPKRRMRIEEGPFEEVYLYQFKRNLVHARLTLRDGNSSVPYRKFTNVQVGGTRIMLEVETPDVETALAGEVGEGGDAFEWPDLVVEERPDDVVDASEGKSVGIFGSLFEPIVPPIVSENSPIQEAGFGAIEDPIFGNRTVGDEHERSATREGGADRPPGIESADAGFAEPDPSGMPVGQFDFMSSLVRMVLSLSLLVVLILGGAWGIRKVFAGKAGAKTGGDRIDVVASRYIGPKRSLMLVDVEGERLLISVSAEGINFLTKVESAAPSGIEQIAPPAGKSEGRFNREVDYAEDRLDRSPEGESIQSIIQSVQGRISRVRSMKVHEGS